MSKFEVHFYEMSSGEVPVADFLLRVDKKMRVKLVGLIDILQEYGNQLREPYSKHLEDGIFEIRCKLGSDLSRVLYFFCHNGKIILTNGFVKKTKKIQRMELEKAKRYRKDYLERCEEDEI